ncbi:MAG: YtxH domain-containing protein [Actinomycetota bacterium]|nr:YtxH domain-containing protein [Actinomycetota bacterium]
MGTAASDRADDAVTRVASAVVVPVVAVAAHGMGAGGLPSTGGMLLTVGIGVLAALGLRNPPRRSVRGATLSAAGVLSAAQVAAHLAMSVGAAPASMHVHHDALLPMALTHAVAIPVSAVLIVAAAGLLAALTSTIRTLTGPPIVAAPVAARVEWVAPTLRTVALAGGGGVRGPPVRV